MSGSQILFTPEPKQADLIEAADSGLYRYLFFGGAAGGGKTYVSLAYLILLSKIFPGSKWCVIRKDLTKLKSMTIPSFKKLCPSRFLVKFSNYTAQFTNGSQIMFMGENFAQDKDLGKFDGLEVNGFLIEEAQEINAKTFEKCKLRAGRHIIEPYPDPIILITGNPSQNWTKKVFRDPYVNGTLAAPYCFIPAMMDDNSKLPQVYRDGMETLDTITYERFVNANWDILDVDMPFLYDFSEKKHVRPLGQPSYEWPLHLAFDFNVDPITCIVAQHDDDQSFIHVFDEFRLGDSDIWQLCDRIKAKYGDHYFKVTGDASGTNRNAISRDGRHYYHVIIDELDLYPADQLKLPKANPLIKNSRLLCNSILKRHPDFAIDPRCEFLIKDCQYVEVDAHGEINKAADKRLTHLLDGLRYYLNTYHKNLLKVKF